MIQLYHLKRALRKKMSALSLKWHYYLCFFICSFQIFLFPINLDPPINFILSFLSDLLDYISYDINRNYLLHALMCQCYLDFMDLPTKIESCKQKFPILLGFFNHLNLNFLNRKPHPITKDISRMWKSL
jgi:hypothetical protein